MKIKNLEFLRIIGCIAIILLHLFAKSKFLYGNFHDIGLYHKLWNMTQNGQKAVDLFFILSGFFFILKIDTTKSIWEFVKKKIIRLHPVLIFTTILFFIASLFGILEFTFYDNILNILCLNGTGLTLRYGNVGLFWYCSAMLWTCILYLSILKVYGKERANLIIGIIIFFCYSFIIHARGGSIKNQSQTFAYVFNVGMMRAMGGIGVGYMIGQWYKNNIEKIKNLQFNILQKTAITVVEFMCVFFIINNLCLHKLQFKNDILFIVVFIIAIMLFLIKQGFISKIVDNDICPFLSKYTYSIYITHSFIIYAMANTLWKYNKEFVYSYPVLNIFIPIIMIFALGAFAYHFVEKKFADYFKNKSSAMVKEN